MKKLIILTTLIFLLLAPTIACDHTNIINKLPFTAWKKHTISADLNDTIHLNSSSLFLEFPEKIFFNNTEEISIEINISVPSGTLKGDYKEVINLETEDGQKSNITFCLNITFEGSINLDDLSDEQIKELIEQILNKIGQGETITRNETIYKPVVYSEGVFDWVSECNPKYVKQIKNNLASCQNNTEYWKTQNKNFTQELQNIRNSCEIQLKEMDDKLISPAWLIVSIFGWFITSLFFIIDKVFGGIMYT